MYRLLRPLLFLLPPEAAHTVTLKALKYLYRLGLLRTRRYQNPVHAFGIDFPNPVGLAAGLDKNAEYVDALAALGFGFIEVGTVTPKPQPGNPIIPGLFIGRGFVFTDINAQHTFEFDLLHILNKHIQTSAIKTETVNQCRGFR